MAENKHGAEKISKEYGKPHLLGDVETQETLANPLASRYEADGPLLPKLLAHISSGLNLIMFRGTGSTMDLNTDG